MTDAGETNADLKAKMREALERKNGAHHPTEGDGRAESREKVHGSEVEGGGPKMHRRKAGGGGS
ncbi:DUF5302 domain-containing protein [Nocardioides sp. JQ2195]|uniref:DUF5302 domain-containing protein n=1 Tax=Nocardioides sp. JQ2195 TaxID=2592334 RepID=UPI00143EF140|nr:DUF5302 domain-containing protein [Nocardioides sp. JQ2195]QIX27647.1 DUF5302 domain-containing protein [Nocardioides sp. JQ2195]